MAVSLGIVISIGVGTTVVCAVIGFLVAKCYLNWRRQYRKQKKISASLNGTVQKLVISSQPVDFVPLLIQDQLEAEDGEIDNTQYVSLRGRSTESLLESRKDSKEENFPPPFKRLDTASSILDKSDRKLKKPMETGTRGESLYFDGSGNSEDETEKSTPKKKFSSSVVPPFSQRSLSMHCRPGNQRTAETLRFARSDSSRSLSRDSLTDEGPDHTAHMRNSVVSTVDKNAPHSKMNVPRKTSASEKTSKHKTTRKTSRTAERCGNVCFKVTYLREKHELEVHLVNATGLPLKHSKFLNSFVKLSLKTPSKHLRRDSKVIKNTCNPIFDQTFVFESVYLSELRKSQLKLKLMHLNRMGVMRYELIGELVVDLGDEEVLRGECVQKDLFPKGNRGQCTGELLVSICHLATSSRLQVVIMKLKDLPMSIKNSSVTVELTHKNEIIQQIPVKPKRKSFNLEAEFSFEVATNTSCTLENYGVQFNVLYHDFIRGNELVGQVRLAMDAPLPNEVKHWTAVVLSPHKPIEEWHKLHPPLPPE
ncbi:synaptotagmin-7-like [Montipora foliosa]|uniref:synaptotagmin-7-like n=1 Tax=Montipora foliosa TaxID=591990 RepID=UPI0035F1D57B